MKIQVFGLPMHLFEFVLSIVPINGINLKKRNGIIEDLKITFLRVSIQTIMAITILRLNEFWSTQFECFNK